MLEAKSALHFWQALEYLTPQSPPDVSPGDYVWELKPDTPDEGMPWRDPEQQAILKSEHPRWRFQIFSGIADGHALIEEARTALGAPALALEERRPPSPAACVVLEVDDKGMATGAVFISTVPWAMAQVIGHAGKSTPMDFRGFFGADGMQETIQRKVGALLVERRLVRAAQSDARTAQAAFVQGGQPDDGLPAEQPAVPGAPTPAVALADELRAISTGDIEAVEHLVFDECGWRPQQQKHWRVRAVMDSASGARKASEDPLNSFYAEDLERVSEALAAGNIGPGLDAYLQGEAPPERIDLERDRAALLGGVLPQWLPPGAWPAEHPLVTAQQFAVNTILRELAESRGIFSVNGPPGTGKTTMLKDIVAAGIVSRADVMVRYAVPASAFGDALEIDRYDYKAYELDKELCGFGIVVASANNGAVENISKELPGLAEIADEFELDYFSVVADSVAASGKPPRRKERREHWGLIAAVLGNKDNRGNFANRFWFADPASKKAPAKAKEGVQAPTPDPLRLRSIQSVIDSKGHGALPWHEARLRYQAARARVDALIEQAEGLAHDVSTLGAIRSHRLACAQRLAELEQELPALESALAEMSKASEAAERALLAAHERQEAYRILAQQQDNTASRASELALWQSKLPAEDLTSLRATHELASQRCRELEQQYDRHLAHRPSQLAQIFRTKFSERWNEEGSLLEEEIRQAKAVRHAAASAVATAEAVSTKLAEVRRMHEAARVEMARAQARAISAGIGAGTRPGTLDDDYQNSRASAAGLKRSAAQAKERLDSHARDIVQYRHELALADEEIACIEGKLATCGLDQETLAAWSLATLDRETLHRTAPYFIPALFQARRDLFVAAMELHKSFVVASWAKLRPTLSAFIDLLTGGIGAGQVQAGLMALWDAFFLVVPLVSTTFASLPRLFAGIGREELAWLLIDEAGQASPQQAVGAIWRARRTVVVGDPLQLEPVVGVPEELVTPLLARCAAERQWAPPAASVQVLADRANLYGTYLGKGDERVWLGAPLVVHRRCLDPMFSISNAISYGGLMVHGARPDTHTHWQSCWIDSPAREAESHWIAEQGEIALRLVSNITQGELTWKDGKDKGKYKVYIITPFRKVAGNIRQLLYQRYGEKSGGMSGTVHTFQGKEADNVIFLLGGDPKRPGVISSFAGAKPNLVNVAVTRAKRRLYVVGDHGYWTGTQDLHGIFGTMAGHLRLRSAGEQKNGS